MKPGRVFFFIILTIASSLRASTDLSVEAGWGGKFRPGRWTPVFVTARDSQTRNVVLEFYSPHDRSFAMRVRQGFVIGTEPLVYPLFVPLRDDVLDESVATLRDASSGRELAHEAVADLLGQRRPFKQTMPVGLDQIFLGVSGAGATMRTLENQFAQDAAAINASPDVVEDDDAATAAPPSAPVPPTTPQRQQARQTGALPQPTKKQTRRPVSVGFLEQRRLPAAPIGYDALDALVLNRPDFNALTNDQQQAIVDWVRSGGRLLMWPGDDPLPAISPLINVLPCRVGDVKQSEIPAAALRVAGLPQRFAKLKVRQLAPTAGAEAMKFFDGGADTIGYGRRLGFGHILVLSFDAGSLQFDQAAGARTFWKPILDTLIDPPTAPAPGQPNYYSYGQEQNQRYVNAIQATMQQLGNIPGIGTFGFSYVAGVLIAMMVIVGPVDWFVLRRLGRQPWTWVTTSGWIALITLGAIYMGHIFKSGDLYYHSLRLVDEADGQAVATRDVACIYSPQTTTYSIDTDPESWWRPVNADLNNYVRGGMKNDLNYQQSYRGNTPGSMLINVWNLRFIQGEQFSGAQPGIIDASIHISNKGELNLKGAIANRGTTTLHEVWVRTPQGTWAVDGLIAPGQSLTIGTTHSLSSAWDGVGRPQNWYQVQQSSVPISFAFAGDLSLDRSQALERMLKDRPDIAIVYVRTDAGEAPNPLHQPGAREDHRQIIRALVTLQQQPQGTP